LPQGDFGPQRREDRLKHVKIDGSMPQYVVGKTVRALTELGESLKGAKVAALQEPEPS